MFSLGLPLLSVDSSVGRVDKTTLPQHTLLELLSEGITNISKFREYTAKENPLKEWKGVHLDDNQNIHKITWPYQYLEGTVNFQWIPPTCRRFEIFINSLSGTVDLTVLPERMKHFSLYSNRFFGTLDLTRLPFRIHTIRLSNNRFEGWTDFSRLPASLEEFSLSGNPNLSGRAVRKNVWFSFQNTKISIISKEQ